MIGRGTIIFIIFVQLLCAFFFLSQILFSVFGIAPYSWQIHEMIELGAALGLFLGVMLGWFTLSRILARNTAVEDKLRLASIAFMDVLEERFTDWQLTPAERDVALFAIKGYSLQEIAQMRDVSEGTVKAQTNAIYRKAHVAGRTQLLSVFIDDLMDSDAVETQA